MNYNGMDNSGGFQIPERGIHTTEPADTNVSFRFHNNGDESMKKSNTLLLIAAALVIVAGVLGAYIFRQEKARSKEDQRIAEEINPY